MGAYILLALLAPLSWIKTRSDCRHSSSCPTWTVDPGCVHKYLRRQERAWLSQRCPVRWSSCDGHADDFVPKFQCAQETHGGQETERNDVHVLVAAYSTLPILVALTLVRRPTQTGDVLVIHRKVKRLLGESPTCRHLRHARVSTRLHGTVTHGVCACSLFALPHAHVDLQDIVYDCTVVLEMRQYLASYMWRCIASAPSTHSLSTQDPAHSLSVLNKWNMFERYVVGAGVTLDIRT